MLKVLIITQNEPFFIPKMLRKLCGSQVASYKVTAVTVLEPYRKNKNFFHWFKERSGIYTCSELFLAGFAFIYCKIFNIITIHSPYSIKSIIHRYSLKQIKASDINFDGYINEVKKLGIDVIVSISCPQIFKQELLNSVKLCLNAHGTLLPRHRGVFWKLVDSLFRRYGNRLDNSYHGC